MFFKGYYILTLFFNKITTIKVMKKKLVLMLLAGALSVGTQVEAQTFGEKMKAKMAELKNKFKKKDEKAAPKKVEEVKKLNEWHTANEGKIVFYNNYLKYNSSSADSETGVIKKGTIGGSNPFYARGYFGKPFTKFCEDCDGIVVKYSMGGVSLTSPQIREEQSRQYSSYPDVIYYYDYSNYSATIPLTAAKGQYHKNYTLQEDTYRMLLSRIKDQLKKGATFTLKVELIGSKRDKEKGTVLASGEIELTVTDDSYNLQGLHCRCGKAGMTDAKVIKDVKEAFSFQFTDIKKVNKVVLLARDFSLVYDSGYSTRTILGKAMWANIIYERTDGVFMMVKRYIFYKKSATGFSDKITIGKHEFFLPVSPTCAK